MNKCLYLIAQAFPPDSSGKESACSAGDTGDEGSIPGLERSLEKEMATHSSILAWNVPQTEDPDGLQSLGSELDMTKLVRMCAHTSYYI